MFKKITSLMTVALMVQGVASADLAGDLMCGHFWVAGEALLLRPTGAYPYATLIGPKGGSPDGAQVASCPDYEWGYKIEVGYRNCDKEVLVNWLSFNNGYKNRLGFTGDELAWNTMGSTAGSEAHPGPGHFDSLNTFKYDALDAEVAKWMCKECSRFSGRAFFGLRYARIRNHRGSFLTTEAPAESGGGLVSAIVSRSDVQGTGPRVGLGARWDLWCNFGLTGSAAGHLLIGSAKSQFVDVELIRGEGAVWELETRANVKNRKVCRIIPASEIKFGLDWKGCLFCGLSGELGVGYQITHYFYGDQSTLFTQNGETATGTNHVHTDPVSFDGWYFRVGLMY
jgi:Legionella pneumophila major outer membrane protein precursor